MYTVSCSLYLTVIQAKLSSFGTVSKSFKRLHFAELGRLTQKNHLIECSR